MKHTKILMMITGVMFFSGCQTTSQSFNGNTGYQIESKDQNSAILSYTMASDQKTEKQDRKLQNACQKTLGENKTYKISVISSQEIVNPSSKFSASERVAIGSSKTSIGFSNTPNMNSNDSYAGRQLLETEPSILKIIRYRCY